MYGTDKTPQSLGMHSPSLSRANVELSNEYLSLKGLTERKPPAFLYLWHGFTRTEQVLGLHMVSFIPLRTP